VAVRVRRHRRRRRLGLRPVQVEITLSEIKAFIDAGYLDADKFNDPRAIADAVATLILDRLMVSYDRGLESG
jgi:hypothetical protein